LLAFFSSIPLESVRAAFAQWKSHLIRRNQLRKLLAVVLSSAAIATPALAEDSPFYVGALAGDQYIGVLGGYQIDKMYAAELSYARVLTPTVNTGFGSIKTDHSSIGAELVVMLPWKVQKVPELSFFGKGGLEYVYDKVTTSTAGASASVSNNELKLTLGGGAQYDVSKNFSARAGFGVMGSHNDLYVSAILRF
jgi:opacity protein-like surface antigen